MKVFVSHSSADKAIAETFVQLVRGALNISSKEIRCTSVEGYKLPAGSESSEQLRSEVFGCDLFIALLSPASMQSVYVMFELGARWGTKRYFAPIMVAGTTPGDLKPPLSGVHAIDGTSESDVHQLLADMGAKLSLPVEGPSTYVKVLRGFINQASATMK
ncbi:toll/interleukin-1 receptor domain-containing protein [Idiomarina xiamenensis]|nr:toll/interleukin-1 receptor domain-containing protein [Idiomarina xiamenensis]